MIPTLGEGALVLALAVSIAQGCLPLAAGKKGVLSAAPLATWLFGLTSLSLAALTYAHVTDDFSVRNVAEHSHTLKPMIYKISGVWGNHEGSMLLWVWMLTLWGFLVARAKMPAAFRARALAVQGMIAAGFTLFILGTSNPFVRLFPAAVEGLDLNPVLQDPGLAIHPPLLYTGYVGFSIAFCFAMAALMERKVDAEWAAHLRPWVLAAWIALTLGITSGAVWAYYELGWGGFWFWDPVENASLMPWLAGTALLHSVAVLEKRGAMGNWTVFLALLSFSLSLLGTFLVRSGILTSVHAFANDPERGVFILALLTIAIGGGFLFYALRAPSVKSGPGFGMVSREAALLLNNVFLFTFCVTVLMGTLYPLFLSALDLGSVSVGGPYYNATLAPLLIPFALLMGAAPALAWKRGTAEKLSAPFIVTVLATAIAAAAPLPQKIYFLPALACGGWIIITALHDFWRKRGTPVTRRWLGMALAHAGFGVMIIGIAATTLALEEKIVWMKPGDHMALAGRDIAFLGTHASQGPNFERNTGIFTADGKYMEPEKRWYPVQEKMTSEVALRVENMGLIYIVMGDNEKDKWVVRAYYHPLALFILLGAVMIAAGGGVSMAARKRHA